MNVTIEDHSAEVIETKNAGHEGAGIDQIASQRQCKAESSGRYPRLRSSLSIRRKKHRGVSPNAIILMTLGAGGCLCQTAVFRRYLYEHRIKKHCSSWDILKTGEFKNVGTMVERLPSELKNRILHYLKAPAPGIAGDMPMIDPVTGRCYDRTNIIRENDGFEWSSAAI